MLSNCGAGEDPWESLDSKEIRPVNPKGNQPWIFIGKTAEAEAEATIIWLPVAKNWLVGKDLDTGKDWRWEEKGVTEDKMVGLYHWFRGHEFEKLQEIVKDREAWCAAVHGVSLKKLDRTEWLNDKKERKGIMGTNEITDIHVILVSHIHNCMPSPQNTHTQNKSYPQHCN